MKFLAIADCGYIAVDYVLFAWTSRVICSMLKYAVMWIVGIWESPNQVHDAYVKCRLSEL
jgi:hypothetical protein